MKQHTIFLALLMLLYFTHLTTASLYSQSSQNKSFHIEGKLKGLENTSLVLSYVEGSDVLFDSTTVQDGEFFFKGEVEEPVMVMLHNRDLSKRLVFFLHAGKIRIHGEATDFQHLSIDGSALTKLYRAYVEQIATPIRNRLIEVSRQVKDLKEDDSLSQQIRNISYELFGLTENFIEEHTDSFVSLYLMEKHLNQIGYDKAEKLYDHIADSLKQYPTAKRIASKFALANAPIAGSLPLNFTLPTSKGDTVDLASFTGQPVLLIFWASWCAPCRQKHPALKKLYEQFHAKGLKFIQVSLDENKNRWMAAIEQDELNWPQFCEGNGFHTDIAKAYNVQSVPHLVLLDSEGNIVENDSDFTAIQSRIHKMF